MVTFVPIKHNRVICRARFQLNHQCQALHRARGTRSEIGMIGCRSAGGNNGSRQRQREWQYQRWQKRHDEDGYQWLSSASMSSINLSW
mmetsp:Transcript_104637/g.207812  ORF Transcript_104637/g.207812 Transcript_104637/m.207812 type:complete len:88 (-) Transcript_104637:109-372(-)